MSALHRAMVYLGFSADERDDYDYGDDDLAPVTQLHGVNAVRPSVRSVARASASAGDLRRIQTIKPRSYNDAPVIGESFRQGVPVIINLTEMAEADAKRLVDFAAGLSFGLHGSLERVTTSVFLLSPAHVEIGVDAEPTVQELGFYNQG